MTVVQLGGATSPVAMAAVGAFYVLVGYLVRGHRVTGFVRTTPERSGVSEAQLTRIVGRTLYAMGAVTFGYVGVLLLGWGGGVVGDAYFPVVVALVVLQWLRLKVASAG